LAAEYSVSSESENSCFGRTLILDDPITNLFS
jgi:hypothetical protein